MIIYYIKYLILKEKTLKISYSCTKNIFQIINSHNIEIIKEFQNRKKKKKIIIIIIIIIIVNKTNVIVKLEMIVL